MSDRKPIIITNPPKMWNPGDPRVEQFMSPVAEAIKRHIDWPSDEFTDIYNRAYEAVWAAIRKYDTGEANIPRFMTVGEAKEVASSVISIKVNGVKPN